MHGTYRVSTSREPHDGDLVWITSKLLDIILNPFEEQELVV